MLTNLSDRFYHRLALAFMAVMAIIVLTTFQHYGISWDEEIQNEYGNAVYDYYASFFHDRHYNDIFNLYLYGGMFDGLAGLIDNYTPFHIYETRHLLNALVGLLGLWGVWRLGRLIGGGFVGLASMVLLAATPMYYGHIYNNPKDIPFAVGVVWSLYYMAKGLMAFPRVKWRIIIKLGIIFGLTLGVRVNGVMVMGHWALVLGLYALVQMKKWTAHNFISASLSVLRFFMPVFLIAYAVMLVCWPWAQEAPIENPIRAIIEFSNFPQDVNVILNGITFNSTALPWYYVPVYFYVQLPVLHLILMVAGLFMLVEIYKKLGQGGKRAAFFLLLLTVVFPVAYAMFGHPALYDAVRHFIFILPPLCILAAMVLRRILVTVYEDVEPETNIYVKVVAGVVLFGLFLLPVGTMVRLHPYEYIYINEIEGGVEAAYGHYELDYWSSSFKQAAHRLHDYVESHHIKPKDGSDKFKVAVCGPAPAALIYLPPQYQEVEAEDDADFFISTTRWMCHDSREGHEIARVTRFGVPLSVVKDVRFFKPPQ